MPTISVVIPSFNRAHLVADAVHSALKQTYAALEIIVVDDGSTDGTGQIISGISGAVPIRYHWQPNQGQATAKNVGVALARGDWVAFLDSDDLWYPHKLAVQVAAMEAHPEVPFFYSQLDYCWIDNDGQETPRDRGWNSALVPLLFRGHPNASVPTVLLNKEVFLKEGGFNLSLSIAEDWELFARIAHKYPIHCITQSLAKQRLHPAQITKDLRKRADSYHCFHTCMLRLWKDDPRKLALLVLDTARVYADYGKSFLRLGDHRQARCCFYRSLSYRPWSLKNWRRLGVCYLPGLREWYGVRKAKPAAH